MWFLFRPQLICEGYEKRSSLFMTLVEKMPGMNKVLPGVGTVNNLKHKVLVSTIVQWFIPYLFFHSFNILIIVITVKMKRRWIQIFLALMYIH